MTSSTGTTRPRLARAYSGWPGPTQVWDATDIELWRDSFVEAAGRAERAGFELVELHAAHGYGLNQWLSPLTNRRQDPFGGVLEGRAALLIAIVRGIREQHPGLGVAVRMPGQDFLAGGLTVEDGHWLGEKLRGAGACLLDVSSGIGGWRRPGTRIGEGYLLEESAGIQSRVELPVIGVGGIESGSFIDRALREKKLSLAAVGRAILGDPEGWARKWLDPAPSNFMR